MGELSVGVRVSGGYDVVHKYLPNKALTNMLIFIPPLGPTYKSLLTLLLCSRFNESFKCRSPPQIETKYHILNVFGRLILF